MAGNTADVLTIVDLSTYRVLTRLHIARPTSVRPGCVGSALDNSVTCYDGSLQGYWLRFFPVPTPQDFVVASSTTLTPSGPTRIARGFFSTGANNSVVYVTCVQEQCPTLTASDTTVISGIPGALGVTGFSRMAEPMPQELSLIHI